MSVAVIGAGTMGRDIAYVSALAGYEVALCDTNATALAHAQARIAALVEGGIARGKLAAADRSVLLGRVRCQDRLEPAVADAEIVIEAIVEDLRAKRDVFALLNRVAPGSAILATNTSSLSVASVAAVVRDPGRVIGIHFFNPVPAMRLIEVVTHERSSGATLQRALAFTRRLGKEPIVVKDSPGFASSRLGVALGLEAMRMLEAGIASAEDIDKAMELGYNHPMGPLKLSDVIGLDVRLAIAEYLYRSLEEPQFEPPRILRDKVAKGELGKKTGRGFYVWAE